MTKQTKWKLATATFGLPFLVATVALFTDAGQADFAAWDAFVRWQTPVVLALYAASDVLHKALLAKLGSGGKGDDSKA